MSPKKTNEKLTNAEKQRLYRERRKLMYPEKEEENKIKDRKRYHAKKKLVSELSDREKRHRRKNIRERVQRFRAKHQRNTEFEIQPEVPKSQKSKLGRKKVRRDRSKLYRENVILRKKLDSMQNSVDMHRKRAERAKKKQYLKTPDIELSPKSLAAKAVHECFSSKRFKDAKEKVARKLFLHNAMAAAVKLKYTESTLNEKRNFKRVVKQTMAKYRIVRSSLASYLGLKGGFRKTVIAKEKECLRRKRTVEAFFAQGDNSRATSGKKETKTKNKEKRQKRYLTNSIKALHQKYTAQGKKISYETFRKCRPFHVVNLTASDRDSCLCELHSNLKMKVTKLRSLKICSHSDLNQLISFIVCDIDSKDCMYRQCSKCNFKEVPLRKKNLDSITWFEWNKVTTTIKVKGTNESKKIKKIVKDKKRGTEEEICKKFHDEINKFCKHSFNITRQYNAYKQCRDNLKVDEAMIHVDFSENYVCKLAEEVQSYHFGGSRSQVTLHTGILHIFNHSPISFCTISSDRRHNPAAIWAHLEPVFKLIKKMVPLVKIVHFFSDGPTTQYRQKKNFYLFSSQLNYFGFERGTWNFFEAGHGKGAADGVGAALKRKADKLVAFGKDITDAYQFYESNKQDTKVKVFFIEEQDIEFFEQAVPDDLPTVKGTMNIHQIATVQNNPKVIKYRDVSCFCGRERGLCHCFDYKSFRIENFCNSDNVEYIGETSMESNILKSECFQVLDSTVEENEVTDITPDKIIKGTYMLVEFVTEQNRKMKYYYIAVTQDDLEEDGEVLVKFLKACDDTSSIFKLDDNDIAYVRFEQIQKILPMPTIVQKEESLFYKFPHPVEVFEK